MSDHPAISHAAAYAHLAGRFLNQPLAITADRLHQIVEAISPPFDLAIRAQHPLPDDEPGVELEITAGIAVVPITGPLVKHATFIDTFLLGATGYEAIRAMLDAAVADTRADGILLQIHSPGGDTMGLYETAAAIRAIRGVKPIGCAIDAMAGSAAYVLASACDFIVVPAEGIAGSIGVIIARRDESGADADAKVKIEFFTSGDRKADGNPHNPLTNAERKQWQGKVTTLGQMTAEIVGANRGLTAKQILALEAATFLGADAVAHELCDAVGTVDDAIAALRERISSRAPSPRTARGGGRMADTAKAAAGDGGAAPVVTASGGGDQPPAPPAPTPAPPKPPESVAAASNVIDINAERTKWRAEAAAEQAEIKALCTLAAGNGNAALAAEYLNACLADPNVTAATASAKLLTLQAEASDAHHIDSHFAGGPKVGANSDGREQIDTMKYHATLKAELAAAAEKRIRIVGRGL